MGLHRLYWIPDGFDAAARRLRALPGRGAARHRGRSRPTGPARRWWARTSARCPTEVRADMARRRDAALVGSSSSRPRPRTRCPTPPERSMASWGTHDLPRFAAFWAGSDIDERSRTWRPRPDEPDAGPRRAGRAGDGAGRGARPRRRPDGPAGAADRGASRARGLPRPPGRRAGSTGAGRPRGPLGRAPSRRTGPGPAPRPPTGATGPPGRSTRSAPTPRSRRCWRWSIARRGRPADGAGRGGGADGRRAGRRPGPRRSEPHQPTTTSSCSTRAPTAAWPASSGAHVLERREAGASFAVWAPNATRGRR